MQRLQREEYRNPATRASEKTVRILAFIPFFRPLLVRVMCSIHRISPELAGFHVSTFDDFEVLRRFRMYAGMELSAIATKTRAGDAVLANSATRDADGMAMALNSGPAIGLTTEVRPSHARSGITKFAPQAASFAAEERV
jgi:hypothetical protein